MVFEGFLFYQKSHKDFWRFLDNQIRTTKVFNGFLRMHPSDRAMFLTKDVPTSHTRCSPFLPRPLYLTDKPSKGQCVLSQVPFSCFHCKQSCWPPPSPRLPLMLAWAPRLPLIYELCQVTRHEGQLVPFLLATLHLEDMLQWSNLDITPTLLITLFIRFRNEGGGKPERWYTNTANTRNRIFPHFFSGHILWQLAGGSWC